MDLKTVDLSTLSEVEQMQLYPFYDAYNRKYPPAMTWRDCRAEGLLPVEYTHCGMTEIEESLDELDTLSTFHINADGDIQSGSGERADWQDRLINKWARRSVWSVR